METQNQKNIIKADDTNLLTDLWSFIRNVFQIKERIDIPGTISEIKKGLTFEGARVWILSASIITASIGLNIDSIPVIIGAMLIAPLMSPILGIGVSLGINDWATLKKSLKGLSEAVGISLVVATIYFILSPINTPGEQIIFRTVPTILDILIAFAGGLACIVSFSLKDKGLAATVIPGVAVATALMPPLCTAAFGIAHLNFGYFIGAFYLFVLNAIFIALPAYIFVKMMKFPKVHLEDASTEAKHKRYVFISLMLIMVPSVILFVGIVKDSMFRTNVNEFVQHVVTYEGADMVSFKANYDENKVEVFMMGAIVPLEVQSSWKSQLDEYGLDETTLKIRQSKDASAEIALKLHDQLKVDIIEDLYKDKDIQLKDKDEKIALLESELVRYKQGDIPLLDIEKEIQINYNNIENFSYNQSMELNFSGTIDTIPTFIVKWHDGYRGVKSESDRLSKWLETRLKIDSVRVVNN